MPATHGPSACAMAFRVKDAKAAHARALELGATDVDSDVADGELDIPAIEGIGGSRLYLRRPIWRRTARSTTSISTSIPTGASARRGTTRKLTYIDHLTHNVNRGRMAIWADFYEKLFNFREIRYFDIEGKVTGLFSKAMTSPCGKIRIPLEREPGRQEPDRGVPARI